MSEYISCRIELRDSEQWTGIFARLISDQWFKPIAICGLSGNGDAGYWFMAGEDVETFLGKKRMANAASEVIVGSCESLEQEIYLSTATELLFRDKSEALVVCPSPFTKIDTDHYMCHFQGKGIMHANILECRKWSEGKPRPAIVCYGAIDLATESDSFWSRACRFLRPNRTQEGSYFQDDFVTITADLDRLWNHTTSLKITANSTIWMREPTKFRHADCLGGYWNVDKADEWLRRLADFFYRIVAHNRYSLAGISLTLGDHIRDLDHHRITNALSSALQPAGVEFSFVE